MGEAGTERKRSWPQRSPNHCLLEAGNGARTRDPQLGKLRDFRFVVRMIGRARQYARQSIIDRRSSLEPFAKLMDEIRGLVRTV